MVLVSEAGPRVYHSHQVAHLDSVGILVSRITCVSGLLSESKSEMVRLLKWKDLKV